MDHLIRSFRPGDGALNFCHGVLGQSQPKGSADRLDGTSGYPPPAAGASGTSACCDRLAGLCVDHLDRRSDAGILRQAPSFRAGALLGGHEGTPGTRTDRFPHLASSNPLLKPRRAPRVQALDGMPDSVQQSPPVVQAYREPVGIFVVLSLFHGMCCGVSVGLATRRVRRVVSFLSRR